MEYRVEFFHLSKDSIVITVAMSRSLVDAPLTTPVQAVRLDCEDGWGLGSKLRKDAGNAVSKLSPNMATPPVATRLLPPVISRSPMARLTGCAWSPLLLVLLA